MRNERLICRLLLLVVCLGILSPFATGQRRPIRPIRRPPVRQSGDDMTKGLQFRLSEGAPAPDSQPVSNVAPAAPLAESDTQSVLRRLPPVKAEATDEQDFALRDRSLPAPRTGKTITEAFPPPVAPDAPDARASGPLEVTRFAPEGDVPLAPHLSVTFSQPMVAVTSHAETVARGVPVKLSPEPPGKWRWIGAKTLLFEPEGRFPMATTYQIEAPAGTRSAIGGTLATAKRWSFATPPPQVKASYPNDGPHVRNPLFFIEFDQRIDPAAVLETIKLRSSREAFALRLATPEEVQADPNVSRMAAAAEKGRWLAFRAANPASPELPLPGDTSFTVAIGPGTPSAEGPRKTTAPQQFGFRTYGPLRVTRHDCGYGQECRPFMPWSIQFTNPLDAEAFDKAQVRVEPEMPGMKVAVYGSHMSITGMTRGRTTYRVTLDGSIRDQFGQTLGQPVTVSFNVGSAYPALAASGEGFVVLDPTAQPRFSVYSINHNSLKVRLYKVEPEHWAQFAEYMREYRPDRPTTPPGRLVFNDTINIEAVADQMVETRIDLRPALTDGYGHAILIIEPTAPPKDRWNRQVIHTWIQATGIGLDAFVDNSELVGWATSLQDGKPIGGAQLTILDVAKTGARSEASQATASDGLARLPLGAGAAGVKLLVARKGNDIAILPENFYWWGGGSGWQKRPAADYLRWFVFDDRKMYRPGEEVHVKGWIRRIGGGQQGDVGALDGEVRNLSYVLRDSRGNEVLKGNLQLNALGGFDTAFKLPPTMNLGPAMLQLHAASSLEGEEFNHAFQVQEFRRPEYEVTAQASEGPHFVGGQATATVSAAYYAGGGLPNADVNWTVTSTPTNYTPPNRGDFTFGQWIPWWIEQSGYTQPRVETFTAKTDAAGKHHLKIDFISADPPRPYAVTAEASVTDVNRQAWSASARLLVHPAQLYVGLRSERTFVQKGEPLVVQSIVTDIDGKAIAGREIRMRAVRLDWVFEKGQWQQKEVDPQECNVRSTTDPVTCRFETKEGGTYRVTATVYDDRERANQSELTLWVAGGKRPPQRDVEQEKAELIPDRKEYQAGDTAEILVQSPFYPAEGVLTLRRSGLVETQRFTMNAPSHTLRIPIQEGYVPNLYVQVDLVGAAARTGDDGQPITTAPKRPAYAAGSLNLLVPPLKRKLAVTATPRDKALEPGGETTVDVELRDATGEPVAGGELAVVVVDEAVLALTGYRVDDPTNTFYSLRDAGVRDHHLREKVLLANPEDLIGRMQQTDAVFVTGGRAAAEMAAPPPPAAPPMDKAERRMRYSGTAGKDSAEPEQPINLRTDFNALATFAAAVPTDSNGRASVKVKVPDNLTRYRVMAVAVAGGKQFGISESNITARLPLMARPSPPRFLNFGDRFELPVVLQNQTDAPMEVNVAVRATNAELTEGMGRRVTVPANDRVEVRFPAAAVKAGTARFQIGAVSGRWADAAEVSLPVWTPATTEAFATYGEIDQGAIVQPVQAPPDVVTQFGGLEVTTSSTQLQALTDAVLYLVAYPFECAEQLSSRILAVAALRDVLTAFEAKGLPKPEEMKSAVARDIKRLQGMQNDDGGFGFWKRGDRSWPYVSIHVAHALQRAKEKKFEVPSGMLDRSKDYLQNIERHIPSYCSPEARRALIAYALYVRNRMGDRDPAKARRLIAEAGLEGLSMEAIGWILPVLSADPNSRVEVANIRKYLGNRVEETAATAHFTTSYSDGAHLLLHSDRRADGVILEALIGDQPSSDLIPKIVRGLLAHRKAGRWENTQENCFILLALDRYFGTYEKATPDFVARAWLGDAYAGGHEFRGRTTDSHQVNVPMKYLAEKAGAQNLILSKEGPGRLYYRVGMQYAPASLKLDPADHGFTVERVYEAVDKADDVRRDADGTWRIKAGAKVRVRLTMVAQARRYHVALVDPMPAGLEALNPALAVTGSIPQDPKDSTPQSPWWWWRAWQWFEHQNMRDERVEAFTSLLWEGVYNYSYVARATTPGVFVVPPAKAEEMYHPETFGRSAGDRVIVE
ncbi:MAG TPA: alpha-2-macroglobulin family protein [Blastocatellia bacterium]|nr:alpha-2-macroglobulin family protein [Blastocatellia bacterium]